jgi:hypothetical protein
VLLKNTEEEGTLKGVQLCTVAPKINHVFFADDSLIVMKANVAKRVHSVTGCIREHAFVTVGCISAPLDQLTSAKRPFVLLSRPPPQPTPPRSHH